MLLWDLEMVAERELINDLTPRQRLEVGVSALSWTVDTLPQPIETVSIQEYLSVGMEYARQAVSAGEAKMELPADILDQFEDVDEAADEPGTSHFLAALMVFQEVDHEIEPEQLYGVLSYCYEGSLDREGLDEWSPENERQNQRCLDVIRYQKTLIERELGRR